MSQNQPFEIPQQLRELAERNVETSTYGFRSVNGRHGASNGHVDVGDAIERDDRSSSPSRTPRPASRRRASLPMPRTSRICLPFRAALHRRRCRPMLFRLKSSAG
jgi:hypothetical protein